ncbi:Predicted arabinose efflux permease, MFS family [Oceanospirillum multiglobuliferum]|uniref:Major facilitator superfamily (MFS) profile domain-containing protein n=1 Tax=Oceanospirillum multiglobuliferum TaxID=64969 RepID=A0A1T4QMI2_9GAMM|nr:MFS transporter [Oceanospirillum multiglobuliferum]OPX56445.1 hypothetical protein BTE48_03175 [Oceanospirillum multiglobuliferum]SKA04980.1 Predicted arabinose efflux permease, MFS family [Oceanospirillum multiglobuliferum]
MNLRNIILLSLASALAMSVAPALIFIGGLIGTELAPQAHLATLPIAFMVIGTALSTIPAALIMQRLGRKQGFIIGASGGILATLLASFAIQLQSFWLFVLAATLIGFHLAFVQQYRFAAVESAAPEQAGKAISFVLVGGVIAAFIGPELARLGQHWLPAHFAGSFLAMSATICCALILLLMIKPVTVKQADNQPHQKTSLRTLFSRPGFLIAVAGGVISYSVMSFVMTATPISMHVMDKHSLDATARVIQSHVAAMYLPSLLTGMIIGTLGTIRVMAMGAGLLLTCSLIALNGHGVMHYWWALVALGIGWNFLFVGSTTLLTKQYQPAERYRAQAVNDFSIFSLQAVASLSAGQVIHGLGWQWVNILPIPLLLLMLIALFWFSRKEIEMKQLS